MQDCSNTNALAMELPQSCAKASICAFPRNLANDAMFCPILQDLFTNKVTAMDSFGMYGKQIIKRVDVDIDDIAIKSYPDVHTCGPFY